MNHFQIEQLAIKHWPGITTSDVEGWQLNFANGFTKRANCIHPIFTSTNPIEDVYNKKIALCEELYNKQKLPTIFKITPFVNPKNLDEQLEHRQYIKVSESIVLCKSLDTTSLSNNPNISFQTLPSVGWQEWLDFHAKVSNYSKDQIEDLKAIISNIDAKKTVITLIIDGVIVSGGLGILDDGYVSIYCLATDEKHRKKGYATEILRALWCWGLNNAANASFILVDGANSTASHLYLQLGYVEQYRYWYRIKY